MSPGLGLGVLVLLCLLLAGADTGSTGSSTGVQELGAGGDTEYASDTPSDDNTEAGTEEGENISEVTCDNTIEEEAETPDRHFLDSEPVSHVSDTGHEWREDENEDKKDTDIQSKETSNCAAWQCIIAVPIACVLVGVIGLLAYVLVGSTGNYSTCCKINRTCI